MSVPLRVWAFTLEALMQLDDGNCIQQLDGGNCIQQLFVLQFRLAVAPHCVAQRQHKTHVTGSECVFYMYMRPR